MDAEERARRLIGDMPWITDKFDDATIDDMRKQIQTCIEVSIEEAINQIDYLG